MRRLRDILIAGTVMPPLLLGQGVASAEPAVLRMAQAPAGEPKREEPGHGPQRAPAQAPVAPRAATPTPPAPHAAPPQRAQVPEPRQAPAAAPRAEPHAAPPQKAQAPEPHQERAAPPAARPAAPSRAAEPARQAPAAAAPRPAESPAAERREHERETHPGRAAEPAPAAPAAAQRAAPAPVPGAAPGVAPNVARPGTAQAPGVQPGQARPPGQGELARPVPGQPLPGQGPQSGQAQGQPGRGEERRGGISTGGAVAIGAAAGLAGGFLAATGARGIDDIRRDRREVNEGGVDYIREPGRTIVREGDRAFVVHDENERFRDLGLGLRTERRGADSVAIYDRPDGEQILTFTDNDGRLLRRVRRFRDGREFVLIDNGYQGRVRDYREDLVVIPEEPLRIPRDRFIVDAEGANEDLLYETLSAPPVAPMAQRYTLDQVRYSPTIRARMRSVDVDSLNFDSGSWIVPQAQANKLQIIGEAIKKAVSRNQNEVFLVEGYTDATGNPTDNLSLSDRRAQSVATILTRDFGVPPENLTTQGYGQQYLKEQTQGSSRINRRVTLRRITPLLAAGGPAPR